MKRHTPAPSSIEPAPEMLVVADGFLGARLLKQVRGHRHLHVYWPGRGETYLCGAPCARVTILSGGDRLTWAERTSLRNRLVTWCERALWLEATP